MSEAKNPQVILEPTKHEFTPELPEKPFWVRNIGDEDVKVLTPDIIGSRFEFHLREGTCRAPMNLGPGESCEITIVVFTPQDHKIARAHLYVPTNLVTLEAELIGNNVAQSSLEGEGRGAPAATASASSERSRR